MLLLKTIWTWLSKNASAGKPAEINTVTSNHPDNVSTGTGRVPFDIALMMVIDQLSVKLDNQLLS